MAGVPTPKKRQDVKAMGSWVAGTRNKTLHIVGGLYGLIVPTHQLGEW